MTAQLPLVVDLDDTLLLTDTLAEAVVDCALRRPFKLLSALPKLADGRARFKAEVFDLVELDVDALPARDDLVEYIREQRAGGREVALVTATPQTIAEAVAGRFEGLFDTVHGSTSDHNLKGSNKARFLAERYPDGFVYAGDSAADLKVWSEAGGIIFAGASKAVRAKASSLAKPVEASFDNPGRGVRQWRKALRLHQWAKNLLLFVALALSGQFVNPQAWVHAVTGFFLLGVVASATYLLNDLVDLSADRRHRTKRNRPFASGALSPVIGLILAPTMILAALVAAITLSPAFSLGLMTYLVVTMAYSFGLKKVAMLDVFILASLFTVRIALGALAINVLMSEWLLTFSMFFFLSLSLAKRHIEVAASPANERVRGRGYMGADAPLTLGFGIASGVAAILIMVLYLAEDAFPSGQYAFAGALWAVPALITLWLMRIWLLANRGTLEDDPVAFAVKDRISLGLGAGLAAAFAAAILIV